MPISWIPGDAEADASNSGTGFFQAAGGTLTGIAAPPTAHFLTAGPSYDAASGRWVPVPAAAISPDGLQYAYAEWDPPAAGMAGSVHVANGPVIGASGRVHVVDAKTGADRVIFSGHPTFSVLRFANDGIYLAKFSASIAGTGAIGLYRLALSGGTPQVMPGADVALANPGWTDLEGTAAWGTSFSAGVLSEQGPGNQLLRYDLATHAVTSWLTVPEDHTILLLGVYSGSPIVLTLRSSTSAGESNDGRVLLLPAASRSTELLRSQTTDPVPAGAAPGVADSHGLWLGGVGTLWLYAPGAGLSHVSLLAADSLVSVGGPCA